MSKLASFPAKILTALALAALAVPLTFAQQSDASGQKSDESQQPTETLKVNVNVVQLFFNVKDKHGALIPNLSKDDFEVYEDGKQQTIKYFKAESDLPLTLGILIDSSGSQLRVLDMEKEVGGAFLKQILTDKDLAYFMDFNIDAELIQDYTRDVHRLQAALNKVKINTGYTPDPCRELAVAPCLLRPAPCGALSCSMPFTCPHTTCWPRKSGARP